MIVYSFLFLKVWALPYKLYAIQTHVLYGRQHPYNAHNTSCTLSAIKIQNINKVTGVVPACLPAKQTQAQIHQLNLLLWLVYLLIYICQTGSKFIRAAPSTLHTRKLVCFVVENVYNHRYVCLRFARVYL